MSLGIVVLAINVTVDTSAELESAAALHDVKHVVKYTKHTNRMYIRESVLLGGSIPPGRPVPLVNTLCGVTCTLRQARTERTASP